MPNTFIDPIRFAREFWPHYQFYDKQREIIYSVVDNFETVVVAGNQLGKDFIAGYICLWFLLTGGGEGFGVPVRIVTTSVKDDHLDVLWGEILRHVSECNTPLDSRKGGPLWINHRHIRKVWTQGPKKGEVHPRTYLRGMVSEKGEGLGGHHAPKTLCVFDEASGCSDEGYMHSTGWAKKYLIFGNPWDCQNFFRTSVEGGDILRRESIIEGVYQ